jgi:hypothetical protein
MRPVVPVHAACVGQPHERFVHQRGALERVTGPPVPQAMCCLAMQLRVQHRRHLPVGVLVAGVPRAEERGHLTDV